MYRIGVNFDLIYITAGIVDDEGKIIFKESVPTLKDRKLNEIIKDMTKLIKDLCQKYKIDLNKDIEYIGVGCYGTIDRDKGIMVYSSYFGFRNASIADEFKKHISIPVYFENDANCYALAESRYGATKKYSNSVIVSLGTAVSGGIIINNSIYRGSFYGAGEFGHHVILMDGEKCDCGRNGCWAAYASSSAIVRDARIAAVRHPKSEMFKMVNGDIRLMSYRTPFEAAEKGDVYAMEIIKRYKRYISIGLINIINILQPEAIAIGGKMRYVGNEFIKSVAEYTQEKAFGQISGKKTEILLADMNYDAVIIGASMLGREK